jgi:hypothetical protein
VGKWVLTCTECACPPRRTSRKKRINDNPPPNHIYNVGMVLVALARNFSGTGVVLSMIGKSLRQWVGACDIGMSPARYDVDFMRV